MPKDNPSQLINNIMQEAKKGIHSSLDATIYCCSYAICIALLDIASEINKLRTQNEIRG
jgi:hypothetical protein